ncbi:M10 family metallopeptidase [Oceanicella sp. SM1341]|uniref:M10 family metallopeptidase n=1 Tax=Oceanicella sp. SM1341 TaxID=1548889 RepID=UPI000E544F48|nr:M10 family metallopeptidase [Oceanicella sp. SM1341]
MPHEPDGVIDYGATPYTSFTVGTGDQNTDGLLVGARWTDASLTYSFPSVFVGDYGAGYPNYSSHSGSFSSFSAKQEGAAVSWLAMYAAVSGLSFTELDGAPGALDEDQEATLRFANSDDPGTAYAYYPGSQEYHGDMWFNGSGDDPDMGDYDWHTIGHELGHALGLKHGQETGGIAGAMNANRDSMEFSIMTYRSYVGHPGSGGYTNAGTSYAQSLMMYDIAAIQFMYGANFSTNSTGTTYSFSTTTGEMFVNGVGQGTPLGNIVFRTIWDGNGVDTYDLSNYSTDLDVDLRPGYWIDLDTNGHTQEANLGNGNYARGSIFNALQYNGDTRSLIENAYGGSGDDTMYGNAANNTLRGNDGDDRVDGGMKNSTIGTGNDYLYGGAGNDQVDGDDGNDYLYGGSGSDYIYGDQGADFMYGADDVAGAGATAGDVDRFYGGAGNDYMRGADTVDYMYGGTGNDELRGNDGDDYLYGGDGTDEADYTYATGAVTVNLATGTASGADGNDVLSGIENISGSNHSDSLTGDAGANLIYGQSGNDTIEAGAGADTAYGGAGNDTFIDTHTTGVYDHYVGGSGTDTLVSDETWVDSVLFSISAGAMTFNGNTYDTFTGIENFTLGGGADFYGDANANRVIINDTGPASDNTILTYGGNDSVYSGIGDDYVSLGDGDYDYVYETSGDDTLYGGAGDHDYLGYTGAPGGVNIDVSANTVTGAGGNDYISGFERYGLANGGSSFIGTSGNETVYGGTGDDLIDLETGSDYAYGGAGRDTVIDRDSGTGGAVYGGSGEDLYVNDLTYVDTVLFDIGAGQMTFAGTVYKTFGGFEDLTTGGGADVIGSAAANDIRINNNGAYNVNEVDAGAGNDRVWTAAGNDTVHGGDGNDFVVAGGGHDTVYGGADNDNLRGSNGNDVMWGDTGNDRIYGQGNNDTIDGGGQHDSLYGGAGNDTIRGGWGNDIIDGGTGDDMLEGNGGDDTFVFAGNFGDDWIVNGDFTAGAGTQDVLDFSALGITLADLTISAVVGTGTLISYVAGGDSVVLEGVNMASLDYTDDFVFV